MTKKLREFECVECGTHVYFENRKDCVCSCGNKDSEMFILISLANGKTKRNLQEGELKAVYDSIIDILRKWVDMEDKYYPIVAEWIIGTYFHKKFPTYAYLFFNAMKGSGKSRLLKIVSALSYNGKLAGSMTESVLFRKASDRTLCIDEIEGIGSKDATNLRLLLNAGYKKGMVIERAVKKRTVGGEQYDVEEFEVYCPIAMANIWGMENVLADRCITLVLEKSSKKNITRLVENFDEDKQFLLIKETLSGIEFPDFADLYKEWNNYITNDTPNHTQTDNLEKTKIYTQKQQKSVGSVGSVWVYLYNKVDKIGLDGRDLELFFPLFIISYMISEDVLDETLHTAKEIVKFRKDADREENRDVQLIEFLSNYDKNSMNNNDKNSMNNINDFVSYDTIRNKFSEWLGGSGDWLNNTWIGLALKRLKLISDKRRTNQGIEVILNIEKAKEKLCLFKDVEEIK